MNKSFIVITEYFILIALAIAIAVAIQFVTTNSSSKEIDVEFRSLLQPFDITVD